MYHQIYITGIQYVYIFIGILRWSVLENTQCREYKPVNSLSTPLVVSIVNQNAGVSVLTKSIFHLCLSNCSFRKFTLPKHMLCIATNALEQMQCHSGCDTIYVIFYRNALHSPCLDGSLAVNNPLSYVYKYSNTNVGTKHKSFRS